MKGESEEGSFEMARILDLSVEVDPRAKQDMEAFLKMQADLLIPSAYSRCSPYSL